MRNLFYIILSLSVLSACSKETRIANKLNGEWTLTSLEITTADGWSNFPTNSGVLTIQKGNPLTYSMEISYSLNGNNEAIVASGSNTISSDNEYLAFYNVAGDSMIANYRMLTLTNTDLQLEEYKENGTKYMLIFRKK